MSSELSKEQVEVLYEYRRISESGEAAVIAPESVIESLRAPLEDALKRGRGVDGSSMNIEALAAQFSTEDGRETAAESLQSQMPETGGSPSDGDTGGFSVESLSAGKARDAYQELKLISSLEDRTPEHAARKRASLAESLGCEPEDLDKKTFQDALR